MNPFSAVHKQVSVQGARGLMPPSGGNFSGLVNRFKRSTQGLLAGLIGLGGVGATTLRTTSVKAQDASLSSIVQQTPITLDVVSRGSSPLAQSVRISPTIPTVVPMPKLDLKDRAQVEEFNRTYIAAATVRNGADFGGVAQVDATGKVIAPGALTPLALQVAHIRNFELLKSLNAIDPAPLDERAIEMALHAATAVADRPAYNIQALHNLPVDGRFRSDKAVEGARQSNLNRGNLLLGGIGYGGEHLDYMMQPMSLRGVATAYVPGRSSASAYYLGGVPTDRSNYPEGVITTASGWAQLGVGALVRNDILVSLPGVNARQLSLQGKLNSELKVYQSADGGLSFYRCMIGTMPNGSFTVTLNPEVESAFGEYLARPRKADYRIEWKDPTTGAWRTNNFFYGLFGPSSLEASLPLAKIVNTEVDARRGVLTLYVIAPPGSYVSLSHRTSLDSGSTPEQLVEYIQPLPYTPLEIPLGALPQSGYFLTKIERYPVYLASTVRSLGWPMSRIVPH